MAKLVLQDIKKEGNSVFLTSYPTTGVLGLIGFMEDVSGTDATHTVEKSFRYTTDGINYSEWISLTFTNLTSLSFSPHQIVRFELQYFKNQPLGDNQIEVDSAEIEYDSQSLDIDTTTFDKTIFKKFFETDDEKVLNWYINVLNKLYQKGLIPDYLTRKQSETNFQEDIDFLQFWMSIAKFFAYYVIYARQFQNFHQSESLLFEFLEQRGMKVSDSTTLEQMNILMSDYYAEVLKRGTIKVVEKVEDGAKVDGELLRLLWYKREQDEFIYNPRLPQHTGWNLSNSSPLYRGLYLHDNANKAPEKQLYPQDVSKYTGGVLVNDSTLNQSVLTSQLLKFADFIKIDDSLDYEFSFLIKTAGDISVKITLLDKDLNQVDSYSYQDNSPLEYFLQDAPLYRSDRYLPIKLFLYNSNKPLFNQDTTEIHQGSDLKIHPDAVWVNFEISSSASAFLYGLRLLPLATPYSHGLIQVNNIIDSFIVNNNHYMNFKQIYNHISKYFIPYSSHIFAINIQDFYNIQQIPENPIRKTRWIGGGAYCEKKSWRGINEICETIEVQWVGEESTAFCLKQEI